MLSLLKCHDCQLVSRTSFIMFKKKKKSVNKLIISNFIRDPFFLLKYNRLQKKKKVEVGYVTGIGHLSFIQYLFFAD